MKTTPQPSLPYRKGDEWFFTFYKLDGPHEVGPYVNEETAKIASIKAVRIHMVNGFTDGDIRIVD